MLLKTLLLLLLLLLLLCVCVCTFVFVCVCCVCVCVGGGRLGGERIIWQSIDKSLILILGQ